MRSFKSKEFARFARKNLIVDAQLCRAIQDMQAGSVDADLGGGVFKQRLRRTGQGKSGGFRSIILMRMGSIAIFVFGFAKSDQSNITTEELKVWRMIAKDLLADNSGVSRAINEGKLIEVICDEAAIS
jgi:hypothetical protein